MQKDSLARFLAIAHSKMRALMNSSIHWSQYNFVLSHVYELLSVSTCRSNICSIDSDVLSWDFIQRISWLLSDKLPGSFLHQEDPSRWLERMCQSGLLSTRFSLTKINQTYFLGPIDLKRHAGIDRLCTSRDQATWQITIGRTHIITALRRSGKDSSTDACIYRCAIETTLHQDLITLLQQWRVGPQIPPTWGLPSTQDRAGPGNSANITFWD